MRAWLSRSAAGPEALALEQVPLPEPGPAEVLVRVRAVGVNFTDSLLIRDLYQVKPDRPLVPGGEFNGIVEELGSAVTDLQRGDAVIGICGWGALAEYIAVAADRLVRIPQSLPRTRAAAFLFTYATAYHALHDAGRLDKGETLLVLGAAGGVGSAAIDVGTALGATVIAAASTPTKLDFAIKRGAAAGLLYDVDLQVGDAQKALAGELKQLVPGGVDIILDPVGGAYTEPALRCLAGGGRHLVVGFTAGIPRVPLNLVLLKHCHIIGVDWRTFIQEEQDANRRNIQALLDLWQNHLIEPAVTELFRFEAAPAAIARVESRQAVGKIVIDVGA